MSDRYASKPTRFDIALQICRDTGVLDICNDHDTIFTGGADVEAAYSAGAAAFKRGHYGGVFSNQQDLTDTIKHLVEEHWADECMRCAHLQEE